MAGEETRTAAISGGADNGREDVAVDVTPEAKSSARAGPSRTAAKMTVGGAMKPVVFGPPHRVMALELRTAILNGDSSEVQTILEHNPARHATRLMDTHRGTAAHFIIRNGCGEEGTESERLDLLRILDSAAGAQVDWNATDSSGRTPLHLACSPMRNYVKIAGFLLEHGADPNLLDETGCSPLHDAAAEGMTDVVKVLLQDPRTDPGLPGNSSRTALHKAAYRGHVDVVNLLLRRSPEAVDLRDANGLTALHDASRQNEYRVAERLIEAGADVDVRTRMGATPLHLAARNNALDVAYLLMCADALITLDNTKETPEKAAQRKGHTAMVELLQSPVKVNPYYLVAGIQRLRMPQPTESQQATSRSFNGLVWPSMKAETTLKHDNATLFDLLYRKKAILGQSRGSGNVRWIHVPSNNRTWIEDVFRVLFSSGEPPENRKQKAVGVRAPTLEQAKNATLLRAALKMCNTGFADMDSANLHRTPHFKVSSAIHREESEIWKFPMLSFVLPVLDVDMQQPVYFSPSRGQVLSGPSPVSLADDPGETDSKQANHALRVKELKHAYTEAVNRCRTLDEYTHESIDELNVNFRNGDQVVSHYIERIRDGTRPWSTSRRSDGASGTAPGHSGQAIRKDNAALEAGNDGKIKDAPVSETITPNVEKSESRTRRAERMWKEMATPSRLESQTPSVDHEGLIGGLLPQTWRHIQRIKKSRSEERRLSLRTELPSPSDEDEIDDEDEDGQKSVASDDIGETEPELAVKCIRQQILTVPQLWLWAVGDIVVTAFPENWRATDRSLLPQSLLSTLLRSSALNLINSRKTTVDSIVRDIVTESLDFEASISTLDGSRSYLDVFAAEIAVVSSEVTRCYEKFRTALGSAVKIFQDAIKEETELLVRIDDIIDEIAMIKRVHEDQDHVCVAMRVHQNVNEIASEGKMRAGNSGEDARTLANARHEKAMEGGLNDMRSPRSQHMVARLKRLEEDAMRVRNSIITLLDLRHRQATTENAISSAKQADQLFAQSQVLLVFTVATVIFAPLSWVSSLMALDIDRFSPPKESSWRRVDVFGASFGSVTSTLVLCGLVWVSYYWWFKKGLKSPGGGSASNAVATSSETVPRWWAGRPPPARGSMTVKRSRSVGYEG